MKATTLQLVLLTFAASLLFGIGGLIYLAAHSIDTPEILRYILSSIVGAMAMAFPNLVKKDESP